MTERCGCSLASSGVSLPWRTSSSTSEWSRVRRSSSPSRSRYARESPTWAIVHLVLADEHGGHRRAHAGAALVGARQLVDALVGRLDEVGQALLRRVAVRATPPPSVSTAIRDAISPACAPPMPSATANSGARA